MSHPAGGREIRVVEPQIAHVGHSPTNAAFLHTAFLAFPSYRVSYSAMPEQLRAVRDILDRYAPEIVEKIEWRTIEEPSENGQRAWWRWSWRTIKGYLGKDERVLFTSLSRMQIFQTKWLMRLHPGAQIRVVLHGDLEELLHPRRDRFPLSLLSVANVLKSRTPKGLRYLLLGRSIFENVPAEFHELTDHAGIVDIPSHFPDFVPQPVDELVFGTFGNSGEGHELEEVVRAVKAQRPNVRFRLVGFLSGPEPVARLAPFVERADFAPLTRAQFIENAREVTHTLWVTRPGGFRLRASATFFDALGIAAPLVYTRNPYIDAYRDAAPGIGWPCADTEAVIREVVRVADAFDPEAYREQQAAMLRFRTRFLPENQTDALRTATGWTDA